MRQTFHVPADEVMDFLLKWGARKTDGFGSFPGVGERQDEYVEVMQAGKWDQPHRPIHLDARSGTVWQGGQRVAAIAQVDWTKVKDIPMFTIEVQWREP